MTIKELLEFVKREIKDMREDFGRFYTNEFLHLRKKVDWIFIFMLMAAVSTVTTLILILCGK